MMIDTHCHLDAAAFDKDRSAILDRCSELGIRALIIPGVTQSAWDSLFELTGSHQSLFVAPGIHPCFLDKAEESDLKTLEDHIQKQGKIVALGEIGLDFFIKDYREAKQLFYFTEQTKIAGKSGLPLILHVRKAHDQVISYLKRSRFNFGGVVHCYSGSLQQATKYLDLGFKLGIGGVITYQRSSRLRKIVSDLPLESFVLETDAPDIPLSGKEGRRNSPEYLVEILDAVSVLRKESREEVRQQLYQNTQLIFPGLEP